MKQFLKDHPTLLEVLQFIAQDDPEKEKMAKELISIEYAREVIEKTQELRRQPGCQDYMSEQGFCQVRINRDEALRFAESIKDRLREDVKTGEQREVQTGNRFVKDGDRWFFSYHGLDKTIGDWKGVGDVAILLSKPFHGVEAVNLLKRFDVPLDPTPLDKMTQEQLAGEGLSKRDLGTKTKIAFKSEEEKEEYRKCLTDLASEIAEAERTGESYLLKELKSQENEILNDLGQRAKPAESEEHARKAVTRRIKTAIKKIKEQHPALGEHLSRYISTGKICTYRPDPETLWEVKF
jgi:hypothetical protein